MIHATEGDVYVGQVFVGQHPSVAGAIEAAVEVRPEARRRGLASAAYDWAEELFGQRLAPADSHTPLAAAMWRNRRVERVAG
jgi:GNAT superfamily N-acetyltransferase